MKRMKSNRTKTVAGLIYGAEVKDGHMALVIAKRTSGYGIDLVEIGRDSSGTCNSCSYNKGDDCMTRCDCSALCGECIFRKKRVLTKLPLSYQFCSKVLFAWNLKHGIYMGSTPYAYNRPDGLLYRFLTRATAVYIGILCRLKD